MVNERRQGVGNRDFLSTALGTSGNEHTAHLACKCTLTPQRTCRIPECFPLDGEVSVTSWDAEEEGIEVDEVTWKKDGVVRARRGFDAFEDVFGQSFLDLINGSATTCTANAPLDGFSHFSDVPIQGVDDDSYSWTRHIRDGTRDGGRCKGCRGSSGRRSGLGLLSLFYLSSFCTRPRGS